MKNVGFLIVLISLISVSCRKTRVCECTYSDGTGSYTESYTFSTKDEAKERCSQEAIPGYTTCELN